MTTIIPKTSEKKPPKHKGRSRSRCVSAVHDEVRARHKGASIGEQEGHGTFGVSEDCSRYHERAHLCTRHLCYHV